jgi:hypothetical protein
MHKFLIYLSICFCLTCFGLSFSPSSEAGVQIRQWFCRILVMVFSSNTLSVTQKQKNLLTPWRTVLLEKLTGLQLVKKFLAFYGTRTFITAFTSARHLSLSWTFSIQSITPHPTYLRSILILSSHLRLRFPNGVCQSDSPTKPLYTPLPSPHTRYMPLPSHSSRFYHPHSSGWIQIKLLIM